MAKFMERTQAAILALKSKGFSDQVIRLLQGSVSHLYSGLQYAVNLATAVNSNYNITADERLVSRVESDTKDQILKQKGQLVFNFKHDLVYAGCEEGDIDIISKEFEIDLQQISF